MSLDTVRILGFCHKQWPAVRFILPILERSEHIVGQRLEVACANAPTSVLVNGWPAHQARGYAHAWPNRGTLLYQVVLWVNQMTCRLFSHHVFSKQIEFDLQSLASGALVGSVSRSSFKRRDC